MTFADLPINKSLRNAIDDLGFTEPTPIQAETFSIIRGGKNIVGIAQTGTGKTLAFLLPVLTDLKFSKQLAPRVLILVPTRELVLQVVEQAELLTKYSNTRIMGVYGGTNMNTQKDLVAQGCDVLVATPGRLYDLALAGSLKLNKVNKLIIDEVDVMLDLGFIFQLTNIFELVPERRQNIMFSATMTEEVDQLISDFFFDPVRVAIALSGTPLDNISQVCYELPNFYTKGNLLIDLLAEIETFKKVLIFTSSKKNADRLYEYLSEIYEPEMGIIHSNKSQNYRIRTIRQFDEGAIRILLTTDVMARGLDLDQISHVINVDTPTYPENYMHRIGRTGRAEKEGSSILLYTQKEIPAKEAIEELMNYQIPINEVPEHIEKATQLTPEERKKPGMHKHHNRNDGRDLAGPAFHEKSAKNSKTNLGGKYRRELAKKYKKRKTRGDKIQNNKKKKKR